MAVNESARSEVFWIIDRIEGTFAVCEDENGDHLEIPLSSISGPAEEGSVLFRMPDGGYYAVPAATISRRKRIYEKQRALFRKSKEES